MIMVMLWYRCSLSCQQDSNSTVNREEIFSRIVRKNLIQAGGNALLCRLVAIICKFQFILFYSREASFLFTPTFAFRLLYASRKGPACFFVLCISSDEALFFRASSLKWPQAERLLYEKKTLLCTEYYFIWSFFLGVGSEVAPLKLRELEPKKQDPSTAAVATLPGEDSTWPQ